jgi:hypothetical protein
MKKTTSVRNHNRDFTVRVAFAGVFAMGSSCASAFTFSNDSDTIRGSFDSTISVGSGIRTQSPSDSLVSPTYNQSTGARDGGGKLGQVSGLSDQGDINYDKGDAFTTFLKGSHELLLKMPSEGLAFMARGTWLRDFSAAETTGNKSGQDAFNATVPEINHGLASSARDDLRFRTQLLDLWVSKTFDIGDQQGRLRVGNQVVSWGENIYEIGGINATNAIDVNRSSQPGAQVKEFVLPAPIVSFASGLGNGFNIEGYVQAKWSESYLPPVGSYWSTSVVGKGSTAYGVQTKDARDGGQYGLALRYKPEGSDLNLGVYAITYHDKLPQTSLDSNNLTVFRYPEDRHMFGVSANFPVGDWAIGTELSYRPKDAVPLNAASGCVAQGGECWVDEKKFQWHLTSLFALQPSNSGNLLSLLGADSATLTTETVVIAYPGLHDNYNGSPIAPGGLIWGNQKNDLVQTGRLNTPGDSKGTKYSGGFDVDFNWVYDGSLISGWQVVPGVFVRHGLFGYTPNVNQQFMDGVTSMNLYVNFIQNPADWQVGLNYTAFMGPSDALTNPLRDRDFVGINVSRNF